MKHLLERYMNPLREGEGGGSGGGEGGGGEEGGGGQGGGGGGWAPPEGLPPDFAGSSADETLAKLLPAYTESHTRAEGLREKLSKIPGAPKTADEYTFEPSDDLKPFFQDLDKSPVWNNARQAAHEANISQDQLNKFISGVYGPMAKDGMLVAPLDPASEIKNFATASGLDPKGTQAALVEAETFAKGLSGQLKGVPENMKADVDAMLYGLTDTAAGNLLLRSLAGRLSENGIRIAGDGQGAGDLSASDLKALDSDPRIDPKNRNHPDRDKRFDEQLRQRYDEAYRKQG